jgi:alpha-galactosidase
LSWKNNDFIVVDGWRESARAHLEDVMKNNKGYDDFLKGSGETSSHFMRSLATGKISTEMVNIVNRGYIENISDGIIVEVPTFVDNFGLHPQKIGRLPEGIAAKCDALGREYLLAVDAAITGDRTKVLQAFMLDPLAANCDYPEKLFEELLAENASLLPSYWNI